MDEAPLIPFRRAQLLSQGQWVGSYRIERVVGQGGMATVYEAFHKMLGKRVALKMLVPQLALDPEAVARFLREARAASAIPHPGIVSVFDFGQDSQGMPFLVMELLAGESLGAALKQNPKGVLEKALPLLRQIAGALASAHAQGVVHRDLKPSNIMLVPDPAVPCGLRAKVLDFGIAQMLDPQSAEDTQLSTRTGSIIGTPTYMSPEQCLGSPTVGFPSDVYSLGIVVYQVLAGRPPFAGNSMLEIFNQHVATEPPRLSEGEIPEELSWLVRGKNGFLYRMLAKDPALRPTMAEVSTFLDRGPPAEVPTTKEGGRWPVWVLMVVGLGGLGVLTWNRYKTPAVSLTPLPRTPAPLTPVKIPARPPAQVQVPVQPQAALPTPPMPKSKSPNRKTQAPQKAQGKALRNQDVQLLP